MKAVIAYLLHNHIDSALLDYDIQEIKELAKVIGFEVESVVIQKREPDVKYFMGEGKVKELSAMVKDLGVDAVIFNEELSPRQVRALEAMLEPAQVWDRTQVILEIFRRRAVTKESKLQVELAGLNYLYPRIYGLGGVMSRLGGGIGTRGPGETKLEILKRVIRGRKVLGMIQTSSPSYMVMASLDWARAFMEARGKDLLQQLIIRIENLKKLLKSEYGLLSLDDYGGWKEVAAVDPTRLTLDVRSLGITGYQAELLLREAGVQVEMSDMYRLVSIFSVADKEMEFEAFIRGCDYLSKNISLRKDLSSLGFNQLSISREIPEQIMSPREAFYSIIENVPMRESIGRVCAGIIGTYPPGIPRFCPGELIDREGIEELDDIQQRGGNLFGLVDNLLVPVVKV